MMDPIPTTRENYEFFYKQSKSFAQKHHLERQTINDAHIPKINTTDDLILQLNEIQMIYELAKLPRKLFHQR